jgi:hypothetical protein
MTWSGSLVPGIYVLSFRGERIAHVKSFLDPDEALKAAGLAE